MERVATAADVLADRAAIELAQARLDVAESSLRLATLTAPIGGTVAAVSIAEGAAVTASSTSALVTIIGGDGYVVTTSATLSQVDLLAVGQSARVSVRTTDEPLTAQVTWIGLLNTESSSSTPSYAVDLAIDAPAGGAVTLYDGSSAEATVAVADGEQVLTVPTSAVHVEGGTTTVDVLRDGTPTSVEVTTGAVGAERTEVTEGLSAGDEVVLADLTRTVVSDDAASSAGLSGLGGATQQDSNRGPGGGQPPAGFTGGGFAGPPGG